MCKRRSHHVEYTADRLLVEIQELMERGSVERDGETIATPSWTATSLAREINAGIDDVRSALDFLVWRGRVAQRPFGSAVLYRRVSHSDRAWDASMLDLPLTPSRPAQQRWVA